MIVKKQKFVADAERFKDGLNAMPFVLSVKRVNGAVWSIMLDDTSGDVQINKVEDYIDNFSGEFVYEFEKNVDGEILEEIILYRSSFYQKFIKKVANEKTEVITREELTDQELQELESIIYSIDDNHDLTIRKRLIKSTIKKKMLFGEEFINQFSAMNHANGKTTDQILGLLSKYPSLPTLCLTGSIESLQVIMETIVPDEYITEDELNEFKRRVDIFLESIENED